MRALEHQEDSNATAGWRTHLPYLKFDNAAVAEWLEVIRRAVRSTLRVSLRASDGSQRNQDGMELVNDAWLKLQKRIQNGGPVQDARAYAFLTARKLCFDYFRSLSAEHRSLRDCVLRF